MYTVLIAEDEMLVRLGLMVSVPWEQLDLAVVAEAADGSAALEAYRTYRPDIILTDLKMPGMDGLSLIRAVRAEDTRCAIVVVTGVEQFAALHEATGLGISGYLVKATMTRQDMIDIVVKARESLGARAEESPSGRSAQPALEHLLRAHMMERRIDFSQMEEKLSAEGFALPPRAGLLLAHVAKEGGVSELLLRSVQGILRDKLSFCRVIALFGGGESAIMLVAPEDVLLLRERADTFAEIKWYAKESFAAELRLALCVEPVPARDFLPVADAVSRYWLEEKFFDAPFLPLDASGKVYTPALSKVLEAIRENVWYFREGVSTQPCTALVNRVEQALSQEWASVVSAVFVLAKWLVEHGMEGKEAGVVRLDALCQYASIAPGAQALLQYLEEQIVRPALSGAASRQRREIVQAIRFIGEHLAEEQLSLPQVADSVGLHPMYFSSLFKREMGQGFADFVGMLRIERAQTLLLDKRITVQEAAERSGFSDASYFSRKFKQLVGVSPNQWRAQA